MKKGNSRLAPREHNPAPREHDPAPREHDPAPPGSVQGAQAPCYLAPGWTIGEEGKLRRETIHHMGRRLPDWDYKKPWIYMVTIVLENRRSKALGELRIRGRNGEWQPVAEVQKLGLTPEEIEAKVEPSMLGAAIFEHWLKIGDFTPEIRPLHCEIMPDHVHLFLQVTRPMKRPLGNAIAGFKTGCEKIYRQLALPEHNPLVLPEHNPLALPEHNPLVLPGHNQASCSAPGELSPGIPAPEPQTACSRLFAPGFVDTILFRRGQFESEFNYLRDNPRRLAVKLLFPELFRVVREMRVNLRLAPQEPNPAPQEPNPAPQEQNPTPWGLVPKAQAFGYFQAIGNRFLLSRPIVQAQVSRAFFRYRRDERRQIIRVADGTPIIEFVSREYTEHRDELFSLAKHGYVIISPCVSDGERQIAREALMAGLPLVSLQNKGFSPLQKPSGRYFEACSDGRLLMLAPAAWPYVPGEKKMTRFDAVAMNRLAQLLAGDGAAEINYHGMQPENIDELAFAAVMAER